MNPFEEWLQKLFAKPPEKPTKKQEENIYAQGIRNAIATIATLGVANPLANGAIDFLRQAGTEQRKGLDKAINKGISSLSDDEFTNLALDFGGMVGSIESQGFKIPSWLESSAGYAGRKAELKEKLINAFRNLRHPLEGEITPKRIYHSSRGIFEAPTLDPSRQGAGVGDYWQGTGAAYVTELPAVRDYYRNVLAKSSRGDDIKLSSGKVIGNPISRIEELVNDLRREALDLHRDYSANNNLESLGKYRKLRSRITDLERRYDAWLGARTDEDEASLSELITRLKEEYLDTYRKLQNPNLDKSDRRDLTVYLRATNDEINKYQKRLARPSSVKPDEPRVTSYSGFFYANPEELFNLNIPVAQQPAAARVTAALNELPVGSNESGVLLPGERVGDALIRQQETFLPTPNITATNANEMIVSGQRGTGWSGARPSFTSATPWQVMEALKDKGIVGNQYLTRNDFESILSGNPLTNPSYNYVVTDPNRLRFTDLFAAAPFGMAMQSLREEQEKKKNAKNSGSRTKP